MSSEYETLKIEYDALHSDFSSLHTAHAHAVKDAAKWRDEYENLCKFATQFEEQRDALKSELAEAKRELDNVRATPSVHMIARYRAEQERDAVRAEVERVQANKDGWQEKATRYWQALNLIQETYPQSAHCRKIADDALVPK